MILPLFLTHQSIVIGNGFVAQIDARMKILAQKSDVNTILWSVVPADVIAGGVDLDEAHAMLRTQLRQRFVEIAREHQSYEAFEQEARRFGTSIDSEKLVAWDAAVKVIRQMQNAGLLGLPLVKAETETFFSVTLKTAELTPDLNEPARFEPLSGAANVQLAAVA